MSARWLSVSGCALVMRARITFSCSRLSSSNCSSICPMSTSRWLSTTTPTRLRTVSSRRSPPTAKKSSFFCWAVTFGFISTERMRSSRSAAARIARPSATAPSEPLSIAARKVASAYGRATVASSAMGLELRLQLVEHLRVGAGIDFALQDLLRAGHGELRHLLAQLLLGRLDLLLDLRGGRRELALAFGPGLRLRLLDALARGFFRGADNLLGALARFPEDHFALLLRVGKRGLA